MRRFHVAACLFTILAVIQPAESSTVSTWTVNGHTYEAVMAGTSEWGGSWTHANNIAISKGGHLATISDQAEMDFVTQLVLVEWAGRHNFGAWLGGLQPPGHATFSDGWEWVTKEPWGYANWDVSRGAPNAAGNVAIGDPAYLMMWGPFHSQFTPEDPGQWMNLCNCEYSAHGYVIEYENQVDYDGDDDVDSADLGLFQSCVSGPAIRYAQGCNGKDLDHDGDVDQDDFGVFQRHLGAVLPPAPPSSPSPADAATDVSINADLDWADAARATSYDVYFGTVNPPPLVDDTPSSNWSLDTLAYETTYYWKIVAKSHSASTAGPVWSFKTQARPLAPTVTNPSATGTLVQGQAGTITVSCTAANADGTVQSVKADLSAIGGSPTQDLTKGSNDRWSWSGSVTPSSGGAKTVTFTVTDDDGAAGTAAASIAVFGSECNVMFSEQVDFYNSGSGVPGVDTITVMCVQGPVGATVSNSMNGEYVVWGTYTLGTFNTARITLNWGGATRYSVHEQYSIDAKGSGTFAVRVNKIEGGSGNMFLSMASGSSWMFNTVLFNP